MRFFIVLVCCLAIPLVARATDQDSNKKTKQATQGRQQQQVQQQTGNQGTHHGANTASRLDNPSYVKGQGHHQGLDAQNNSASTVQASTRGKLETKHFNTSNSSSRLKGQGDHHQLHAQNHNALAVQSNTKGKLETKANTTSRLNNPSHLKSQGHPRALSAKNNKAPAMQSNTTVKVASRHFDLSNSPNLKIQSVTFRQNYRIQGSQNWKGQRYVAFQNYRGEWHDQAWWHNHHDRIILVSGGWYFWNAGYWSPAWGYDRDFAYYPYNGPIYAYNNLPPDQVIANVQSTLQTQGYYEGEVDGFLGPITRAALADYQRNHGLYITSAIDEPTLDSLGMS